MRIALIVLIALLAGCAARAAGPGASVDVNALVRAHPLYGALAQYDRQIAELRATLHPSEFARKDEAFAHAAQGVRSTLAQSASRSEQIAAQPAPDVRALQNVDASGAPSESDVRAAMQQTYRAQSAQVHADAQAAMTRYRAQLLAQQNAALADYVRGVHARVQQAYASREQQLYEKESTLALDLAKADETQRLGIRTKLQTLALRPEQRRALQAQMNAIQGREDAAVAAQRRQDKATLAAFLPPLQARANADIARMRSDLQSRTAANLAARERVLAAQNAAGGRLDLRTSPTAAASPGNMQAQLAATARAHPADPNAFRAASADLARQFSGIAAADGQATRSTLAQIDALRKARAQLYDDMVSQIMNDARAVARSRGLAGAYPSTAAPPGSVDVTPTVRSDIAALAH